MDDEDDSVVDASLEKFADEEMDREMRRMVQGAPGGMPDSDEEDVLPPPDSGSEVDIGSSEGGEAASDEGGFFSGEDDL